jgi:nitrogen-specific signal transduction histidine kinase/ActR/RegA family two-component response regulator
VTKERQQQRYQEAQDRLATVGQLAAGIAHDFNNVLGIITVYADIMQAAPNLTARQQNQMSTVAEQAHHAANLVRQVLDFSRRSVMERSSIDLYPLVNEQIKLLGRTLPENIQLRFHADQKHFQVNGDPTRLRQVLMNLAINARDAMPDGGVLTFALSSLEVSADEQGAAPLPDMAPGHWVRLGVTDSGSGIAASHLPHVFEPFFTTKGPGQGTGLGLAQVYGIVKQHDGAITVNSAPGQGATFTLYLPVSEVKSDPQAASVSRPGGGSECILLVEDNVDLCQALAQSLETLGYKVLPAYEGATALHLAAQPATSVDLVLSDMVMPGWNGLDLYTALRRYQPEATLLIMTGHPLSQAHAAALQEQSNHWIQKPFALAELAARVRSVLNDAKAGRVT